MSDAFPSLPSIPNLGDVFKAYPSAVQPITALLDVVMRGPSPLSVGERELIAAYVSGLNACAYCHGSHTGFARAYGIDPDLVEALLNGVETAPISDALKPLLLYARCLTEAPSRAGGDLARSVYQAGWSEEALYSVVSVCAVFNMMNRIVEGTGCAVADGDQARWSTTRLDSYVAWASSAGLVAKTN